ncbi:hypothetical protein [Tabrizicola aquatica]|uniref:hypothetical protein n=1 Tax=Tabrizicola aquatica TaxID=909926 RepID=UPI000CD2C258|nr:hypothetical protein [Tabrizicola aquatica]
MRLLVTLALLTGPAMAETPLSAQDFDALTRGRTLTWAEFGQVYGVEQYLPGRKVRWTVLGDDCQTGHWYAHDQAICFLYDGRTDPVCWEITAAGTALHARLSGSPPDAAPVILEETTAPLACFGPEVGV